jgi:hypothetical protein
MAGHVKETGSPITGRFTADDEEIDGGTFSSLRRHVVSSRVIGQPTVGEFWVDLDGITVTFDIKRNGHEENGRVRLPTGRSVSAKVKCRALGEFAARRVKDAVRETKKVLDFLQSGAPPSNAEVVARYGEVLRLLRSIGQEETAKKLVRDSLRETRALLSDDVLREIESVVKSWWPENSD